MHIKLSAFKGFMIMLPLFVSCTSKTPVPYKNLIRQKRSLKKMANNRS